MLVIKRLILTYKMSELLAAIRQEIKIINCPKQFTHVKNKSIIRLFQSLKSCEQKPEASFAVRIERSACKDCKKNVFVTLKWYITLHEVIQQALHIYTIERVISILNAIQLFETDKKYQKYVLERLVKPYRQYLNKLAHISACKLSNRKQSHSPERQSYFYCQYNLMVFVYGQLSVSAQEFSGFLKKCCPFLTKYLCLIGRDISILFKHVKQCFKRQGNGKLTFLQIQKLGNSLDIFRKHRRDKFSSWIDIQTDADSQEIGNQSQQSPSKNINHNHRIDEISRYKQSEQQEWGMEISIIDKYEL